MELRELSFTEVNYDRPKVFWIVRILNKLFPEKVCLKFGPLIA